MTPIYHHRKDSCRFCGQATYKGHNGVDVYVCNTKNGLYYSTILIRYGDEPHEYYAIPWPNAQQSLPKDILELLPIKETKTIRDYIKIVESYHGKFYYAGNCIGSSNAPYLEDMMDKAKEVSYKEVYKAVGIETLSEIFSNFYWGKKPNRNRGDFALHQDYAVSFFKSEFRGFPCYFVQESRIEYIFVAQSYFQQDEPEDEED